MSIITRLQKRIDSLTYANNYLHSLRDIMIFKEISEQCEALGAHQVSVACIRQQHDKTKEFKVIYEAHIIMYGEEPNIRVIRDSYEELYQELKDRGLLGDVPSKKEEDSDFL